MLQQTARSDLGYASAGDVTRPTNLSVVPALAVDEKVCVGCFVQLKASPKADSIIEVTGASNAAIAGKILGVVRKGKLIPSFEMPLNIYPKGTDVEVITRGFVAIESKTVATVGQYVYLKTDDGTLVFNDNPTLEQHTYTGFRVSKGAKSTDGNGLYIVEITTEMF